MSTPFLRTLVLFDPFNEEKTDRFRAPSNGPDWIVNGVEKDKGILNSQVEAAGKTGI